MLNSIIINHLEDMVWEHNQVIVANHLSHKSITMIIEEPMVREDQAKNLMKKDLEQDQRESFHPQWKSVKI